MLSRAALLVLLLTAVVVPARASAPATVPVPPPVALPVVGLPGSTQTVALEGGRSFVLHVPDGLLGPAPLVVVLHAYAQDAARMRRDTGFEALADREGFVVAFGEGVQGSWAAGGCCGVARDTRVDDLAYLDAVVAASRSRALVDPQRIAVSGFSNGAMMALRYACARSSTVAAAAVVAGTVVAPCAPTSPVAVLDLHGTSDRTVPLRGGRNAGLGVTFPPVRQALAPFARAGGEVSVVPVPGGHRWLPGATAAVWDWVRDHPRTPRP